MAYYARGCQRQLQNLIDLSMINSGKISSLAIGLLLISGIALRTLWSYGGPNWSYWFGNFLFGIFFVLPGITILFAPRFALKLVQYFSGVPGGKNLKNWEKLNFMQKLVIYSLAFMDLVIGGVILITNFLRLINGCSPSGDCLGF